MKDSERLDYEASQIKWDPEALKDALRNPKYLFGGSSACTFSGPSTIEEKKMPDPTREAYDAYRKSQSLKAKAAWARRKEKTDKRAAHAARGKANKAQGSRWEGAVAQLFRTLGLEVERTDERDGYTKGWDLVVTSLPHMVIQCKATKTKAPLLTGLAEAREHNPGQLLWVCFHQHRVLKKGSYTYRVAFSSSMTDPPSITDMRGFFHVLQGALTRGEYPTG